MKKVSIIVVAIITLLLSSCAPKSEPLTGDVQVPKPLNEKNFEDTPVLTKLDSSLEISPKKILSLGFSKCILESHGVRIDNGNFKTDFTVKKNLNKQTKLLEESSIPYYIEVTSGPGISHDRTNLSLYNNPDHVIFFAQMLREMISMNSDNLSFKGIILNIGDSSIDNDVYYNTLNEIANRVDQGSTQLILTLDPLFYESDAKSLPLEYFDKDNIGFNISMNFSFKSYPGDAKFNHDLIPLSKNRILEKLMNIKNSDKKSKNREIIVSLKCPWASGSNVLAKDISEIMKIIDFQFSFSYSNTENEFDYSEDKTLTSTFK